MHKCANLIPDKTGTATVIAGYLRQRGICNCVAAGNALFSRGRCDLLLETEQTVTVPVSSDQPACLCSS